MNNTITLSQLYAALQSEMVSTAEFSSVLNHPTDKGDNTETNWITWFNNYLPNRYHAAKASVIDSNGCISEQIDIVLYDSQYSYLAFNKNGILYLPAESVYAVFEVKPSLSKQYMEYAGEKASSVRRLHRTSAAIPYAGGTYPPKEPHRILAGILATDSEWKDDFGEPFRKCLKKYESDQQVDCGCILKGGAFSFDYENNTLHTSKAEGSLVFFFLELLIKLQRMGTVPAIELNEYMKELTISEETI